VCDALVASVDLAPTILTLAGLAVPEHMQGMSMDGWCLRGNGPRKDSVYLGLGIQPAGWRAIWDGRYLLSRGYHRVLYDHQQDPHEMHNLRASPDHKKLVHRLAVRLGELAVETQDPYLERVLREDSLES
jgi:arylsulfatase A-like enzyme